MAEDCTNPATFPAAPPRRSGQRASVEPVIQLVTFNLGLLIEGTVHSHWAASLGWGGGGGRALPGCQHATHHSPPQRPFACSLVWLFCSSCAQGGGGGARGRLATGLGKWQSRRPFCCLPKPCVATWTACEQSNASYCSARWCSHHQCLPAKASCLPRRLPGTVTCQPPPPSPLFWASARCSQRKVMVRKRAGRRGAALLCSLGPFSC